MSLEKGTTASSLTILLKEDVKPKLERALKILEDKSTDESPELSA